MQRRESNIIHRIKGKSGEWIEGDEEILHSFKESYEDLLRGNDGGGEDNAVQYIPTLITTHDNSWLMKDIQESEVKKVVFSLGENKAPGPDDLSGIFLPKSMEHCSFGCH